MRVLVVGATGALRPAAVQLAAAGHEVYALARHPDPPPPGTVAVTADVTDVPALASALERAGRFDAALVYAPAASPAARRRIADAVGGTLVELLTSDCADPATNPQGRADAVESVGVALLLGWRTDGGGWHSAEELSAAAVAVLDRPVPRTLGTVRPWSDRPR